MVDRYTKAVLTVNAIALLPIAGENLSGELERKHH